MFKLMNHLTTIPENISSHSTNDDDDGGVFIAVEGIDGSGTTSAVEAIAEEYPDVLDTAEPAEQHWTGEAARRAINDDDTHPMTDLMFFLGDRGYHIENTIQPALDDGTSVISDRYLLSTIAYQQENLRGIVSEPVGFICRAMAGWVPDPDFTILLDLPVEVAQGRTSDDDKYEVSEFQMKVRQNYLRHADQQMNTVVVDASQPESDVQDDVLAIVEEELP